MCCRKEEDVCRQNEMRESARQCFICWRSVSKEHCATFAREKVNIFFAKSVLREEPQKVSMARALKEKNFEF